MSSLAEERLAAGDPHGALVALQGQVRERPADAAARVFLFQLLAVLGEWRRAGNQLDVAAELDASTLLMAQTYRELLRGEVFREEVFDGRRHPLVLGEPPVWLASLVHALPLAASGDGAAAATLATDAFEQAEALSGWLGDASPDEGGAGGDGADVLAETGSGDSPDGDTRFDWIGDADMRLGPVLEAMLDGKYYWVPFERLAGLVLEPPSDLRDLVWTPAEFEWHGGGKSIGFVPTRYPHAARANAASSGSDADEPDPIAPACLMARRSEWIDLGGDYFVGRGQRVLASSAGDHALLECRRLRFDAPGSDGGGGG